MFKKVCYIISAGGTCTGWWAAGPALAAPDQEGALGPLDEHLGPWSANKGLQWEGGDLVCGFCSPWVPGLLH